MGKFLEIFNPQFKEEKSADKYDHEKVRTKVVWQITNILLVILFFIYFLDSFKGKEWDWPQSIGLLLIMD